MESSYKAIEGQIHQILPMGKNITDYSLTSNEKFI